MNYRNLVVNGKVLRRSHATVPIDHQLGDPIPGWEGYTPAEIVERREAVVVNGHKVVPPRTLVLVTREEPLEPHEVRWVETWMRLDEIATERGIEQTGPAWDLLRQMQRRYLRMAPEVRITIDDYDRVTASLPREETRLICAYAVALDDPEEALRMVTPVYNAGAALGRMLGKSIRGTGEQWYGEA